MQCYSRYCLQYPFWVKLSALRLRIVAYTLLALRHWQHTTLVQHLGLSKDGNKSAPGVLF